jgi:hypothetical protein
VKCLIQWLGRVNLPYFWDKSAETLPQAELNPLSNPVLERNLNRWADAYFSNPPGKREEAISQLLQEIKNETSEILIAEQARQESSAAPRQREARAVVCSSCRRQNTAGNKFCGQCGAVLGIGYPGSRAGSGFAAARSVGQTFPPNRENEVEWLRERSLSHFYVPEDEGRKGWKYVVAGIMIAFGVFAYLHWAPSFGIGVASPTSVAAKPANSATPPLPADTHSAAVSNRGSQAASSVVQPSQSTPSPTGSSRLQHDAPFLPGAAEPAVTKSSLLRSPTAPAMPAARDSGNGTGGSGELRLAERYLGGSMGARDSTEAAKLLWKSVRQQNATAAVLLSDLYARGDGVPRSCDQARLLLIAAAKQGSPQAAAQLHNLELRGCR